MSVIMGDFNDRIARFGALDIKLLQGAAIFLTLVIVKMAPEILRIGVGWFVTLAVICAARPLYVFFRSERG
jgi:hypothetical protein